LSTEPIPGAYASVTHDSFTVESNSETAEALKANLADSEEKPKDGPAPDPEAEEAERVSKAAAELGKKGGKAAAEARKAKEDAEPDPEPEKAKADEDEEKLGKPRDDPRARMLEATREAAAAKRERDAIKAELAAERAKAKTAPEQRPEPKAEPGAKAKPKVEDFQSYEEFTEALTDYKLDAKLEARNREDQTRSQRQQVHSDVGRWKQGFSQRVGEFAKTDPDFNTRLSPDILALKPVYDAVLSGEQVEAKHYIADEIIGSHKAPELLVYFSEHRDEFQRIAALKTPHAVVREMAKVEQKLESSSDAATTGPSVNRGVSKAKPPVKPVTGSPSTASPSEGSDDEPFEAHVRRENARDHSRVRGIAR
jgi:hypothetical protein